MRIGYEQDTDVLFVNTTQEFACASQVPDSMAGIVMQLHNIDAEQVTPMIEAVPFQITLHRCVLFEHVVTTFLDRHAVLRCIVTRNQFPPQVIVKREIEQRAIHIKQQRLCVLQCGLWVNIHCYTARPEMLAGCTNEVTN